MAFDLVIKNGVVIDGSGLPRYRADVGVRDGRIASHRPHPRERQGGASTPRATWSRRASSTATRTWTRRSSGIRSGPAPAGTASPPSSWATAASRWRRARRRTSSSSCATSSAPRTSRPTRWTPASSGRGRPSASTSTPSTRLPKGINYSGYLGHSALRTYVMGERAFEQAATEDDLRAMEAELRDALQAGAIGFTTSRSPEPRDAGPPPGRQPPGDVGRGAAARRRHGRPQRRHLRAGGRERRPRARRRGRAARLPRAPARRSPWRAAGRSRSACSAARTRPGSTRTT